MGEREFDVILFGATGGTGKVIALYLSKKQPPVKSWAIAGRSPTKLQSLRTELLTNGCCDQIGIVVADSSDYSSMHAMAKRCKVLFSAAGPFAEFGEPVVKACIEARAHYADVTGEFHWVAKMREKYESAAIDASVCLCSFCGYDCIPAETSLLVASEALRTKGHNLKSIELCFKLRGGAPGPGTIHTVLGMLGIHNTVNLLRGFFAYIPESERYAALQSMLLWTLPRWSQQTGNLTLPNFMGMCNAAIIYRTAKHLGHRAISFSDRMYWRRGWKSLWGFLPIACTYCIALPLLTLASIPGVSYILKKALGNRYHYDGDENSSVEVRTIARSDANAEVKAVFRCPGDPGVYCTGLLARECALAMADADKLVPGFVTPGIALEKVLVPILRNSGLTIEVVE